MSTDGKMLKFRGAKLKGFTVNTIHLCKGRLKFIILIALDFILLSFLQVIPLCLEQKLYKFSLLACE